MRADRHGDRSADIEDLLRASKPRPDDGFVNDLERRLLARPEPKRRQLRFRPLPLAAGLAGGFSAVFIALGLAGSGPLSLDDGDDARADRECRFVRVTERVRVPELERARDGRIVLRFPYREVERFVERCSSR